jgi:FkbM family methyltransferase
MADEQSKSNAAAAPRGPSPRLDDLLATGALPGGSAYALRQCRHGPMLINRRDWYVGRSLLSYGEYSEGEIVVLAQLLRPGAIIVEAGSNIGAHTVPLARIAGPSGCVHAFEPQRLQFQLLCANLALNGLFNVMARSQALGAESGWAYMPVLAPDTEQNFGGLSVSTTGDGEAVEIVTIDSLGLSKLNLVKADVEGMEQAVITGGCDTIRRLRPILYVECDRRDKAPGLIGLILSFGYRAWWHLPTYFNPTNYAGNDTDIFPGVVSGNLLALPAERAGDIRLPPVAGPDDWPKNVTMPVSGAPASPS